MNWARIFSGNGLLPARRQAITWNNADLLSIGPIGTNFSEIWIEIQHFSFMKVHLKLSSAKMAAILSRGDELSTHLLPAQCSMNNIHRVNGIVGSLFVVGEEIL